MPVTIALAGNPNSGKTTLFNALTGANQFVGNWPGVTVEKKEGRLKGHNDVTITDLPGVYSLSPYTLEEVVARNYLLDEKPDAILNIIDGTNLERNLYLTTQLAELGIPMVCAVNMMDLVQKRGDKLNIKQLSKELGCEVVEISALRGTGVQEAAEKAIAAAQKGPFTPQHHFCGCVEHALAHIEELTLHDLPEGTQRFYAVKLFERDEKAREHLHLSDETIKHIEGDIVACEKEMDDDAESIITGERYAYIGSIIAGCITKKKTGGLSTSDKIDKIVTNRILALPIFVAVMWVVYTISIGTVGAFLTDWTNDCLFGDGWFISGGGEEWEDASGAWEEASTVIDGFLAAAEENGADVDSFNEAREAGDDAAVEQFIADNADVTTEVYFYDDETGMTDTEEVDADTFAEALQVEEPDPNDYGKWVNGIPVVVEGWLTSAGVNDVLSGLILDGIIGGVGAVLGFVPQMLVLFLMLCILEDIGYMARVAFIMDRIFRRFGLSGKSFIPMLIGSGCGVPGVMASRTIENERDRRMTIMTTCFIPCGAKTPIIALFAGALFGGSSLVATSAYFIGVAAIIISGVMLKKFKVFAGDPAPFVMELPAYHVPSVSNVLHGTWERGSSFIKRAGTVILLSSVILWFLQGFGYVDGAFGMVEDNENSLLAGLGSAIAFIFAPLGFANWQAAVATITGLVAKEEVVSTFGVLFPGNLSLEIAAHYTKLTAYSFMIFNLLCAPCFAAMGAIKREMNNVKWTLGAIGYMCVFAYVISMLVYQLGGLITGEVAFNACTVVAVVLLAALVWLVVRPYKESERLEVSEPKMAVK